MSDTTENSTSSPSAVQREVMVHHERYRRAWLLYQSKGLSDEAKKALEREMDAAQEHFTYEEFALFKRSLPGFQDFWRQRVKDIRVAP
jgi:hypothetical protein